MELSRSGRSQTVPLWRGLHDIARVSYRFTNLATVLWRLKTKIGTLNKHCGSRTLLRSLRLFTVLSLAAVKHSGRRTVLVSTISIYMYMCRVVVHSIYTASRCDLFFTTMVTYAPSTMSREQVSRNVVRNDTPSLSVIFDLSSHTRSAPTD